MKLSEDPNARARMRMVRIWVTAEQYRYISSRLKEVDAAPRGELRRRLSASIAGASKAVGASIRSMMDMTRRLGAYRAAQRPPR